MRLVAVAGMAFALAACGDGGEELAVGNSQLSPAQVDAALGPADQSMVQDALPAENVQNEADVPANDTAPAEEGDAE